MLAPPSARYAHGSSLGLVAEQYRRAGLSDVTCRFYPDARHETLNETNRLEVFTDVENWRDTHIGAQR